MQSINVVIVNPVFLFAFVGTAVLALVAVVLELINWSGTGSVFVMLGAALSVLGSFGVPGAAKISGNDAFGRPTGRGQRCGASHWSTDLPQWTGRNHVRLLAALLASAAFILGGSTTEPN